MKALLAGREVYLPIFDFKTGKRKYENRPKKLGPQDILVIEGIHCLNPKLTELMDDENKFRIYISALTQLNIDEHNRIPSTDGRLIRRIVRDARTRGASASKTIAMWSSVRRGEEENIFPFQEQADVMFNSSLLYESRCAQTVCRTIVVRCGQRFGGISGGEKTAEIFRLFCGDRK